MQSTLCERFDRLFERRQTYLCLLVLVVTRELGREDWIIEPAQNDDAFTEAPDDLWAEVLRRKGGIYELVARIPEDPSVN